MGLHPRLLHISINTTRLQIKCGSLCTILLRPLIRSKCTLNSPGRRLLQGSTQCRDQQLHSPLHNRHRNRKPLSPVLTQLFKCWPRELRPTRN